MGSEHKGHGFLTGFLIGAVIGVIAAIFLSQKGGKGSLKARLGEMVAQGRETIREAIEEGREAAVKKETEFQASLEKDGE